MLLAALKTLEIKADLLAGCAGPSLPDGVASYRFDPDALVSMGQSMGGMYTNLVSAIEPRIRASVPTGAGGFWSYFIFRSSLFPGAGEVLAVLLGTVKSLAFTHPVMQLIETGWEAADPFVSMPRLARRPLPGHPARPIYEPVGANDEYFSEDLYDAAALSYGHQEAGDVQWTSMQDALALAGLNGLLTYPISQNLTSQNGAKYTGVVVQYQGDGIDDPHVIYRQLDVVKHQYACFLDGFLRTGAATLVKPGPMGSACE
jgi:hypothetical protein